MLLIARLDDGRTLYAVEREDRGLYVLCKLGSWVNLQQLTSAAVVSKQELPKTTDRGFGVGDKSQNIPAVPVATQESSKYSKKKRLAIEAVQSMVKRPSSLLLKESQPVTPVDPEVVAEPLHTQASQEEQATQSQNVDEVVNQPTAAEIFENVRTQYFEALYLSKAGVIPYFTLSN